ncbi:MAG: 3-hydroxyacyl-ACP dehydratase FabZ [Eubacterium sp.]|nr:3-hydroxyacyl-ACP dehydratase FabZ [Eubacterium sp.]SEG02279.1 3-hydroxyacyl-[acyl-carrier-protein] dehydratase [Eubacterium ruminantium]
MELSSNDIQKILPHRYPMQLVDKIIDFEPGIFAEGIKCVTVNEQFFCGHFPEEHVMPGVLIIEALAQTGAVCMLSKEENKGKIAFFGGIKSARFKKQVKPGDVLNLRCDIISTRGPIGFGKAVAKVDGKVAAMCEISFVIGEDKE